MASSKLAWGRWCAAIGAGAIVAAVSGGCSGNTNTQGEIVVAIQTDLSLPKDVSQVRIQISTLGVIRFDNTYPVGPDPSMRIPATIGLLPGENPNSPIRIRVVGFKKEHQPRILREVVTTVPPSRVVSLRMPLQWLSDGSALANPLGSGTGTGTANAGFVTPKDDTDPFAFYNRCPDGQTDIGGDCVDSKVDSSTLPDYLASDIFGGGDENGAGGTCFDTQPCMLTGVAVHPVQQADGSCVVAAPSGDPSLVNVALEFGANGDGICADANGAGPCFVPLDKVDPSIAGLGWTAGNEPAPSGGGDQAGHDGGASGSGGGADASLPSTKDAGFQGIHQQGGDTPTGGTDASVSAPFTTIHLPAAVCRKLVSPGFAGQVVVSDSCTSKTPKNPTCGPWSSVQTSSGPSSGGDGGQVHFDGGGPGEDGSTGCTPACNGSSKGSCGCNESCQGHNISVQCITDTSSNMMCTCVVDGQTLYSGAPPNAINCADTTGASIQAAFAACAAGGLKDGGVDAGLFLNIVPQSATVPPTMGQHFDVFLNATSIPPTSVTWSIDGTLGLGGGHFDNTTGDYIAGDVGQASGHVIAMYQGLQATAQVDVGTPPVDGGMDSGFDSGVTDASFDAGFSCPTPSCSLGSGDAGSTCNCSAMCSDSQTWILDCNGTFCSCAPIASSFGQGGACQDIPTAQSVFMAQCHP